MSWLTNLIPKNIQSNTTQIANKNNLYISIDPTRVCFLELDTTVHPNKIITREEVALGPLEDINSGEAVRDLYGSLAKLFTKYKSKFDNMESVNVSIPAEGVFFKNVEVPKIDPKDLQKLVLAEIKKTLPVDFSQVLFAQNDLGEKHENMSSFFCVGIQKNVFESYKNLFDKFHANTYFEIEVFSLARIVAPDNKPKIILQVGRLNSFVIITEGQIIQDVKTIEMGQNDINKKIISDLQLNFNQAEKLKENLSVLKDNNRMGAKIVDQYVKDFEEKLTKAVVMHILEYEKKQNKEIQEVVISGLVQSARMKKVFLEEFDAELKVDFVNEENFGEFSAENFSLEELKRYAQCFGLALRNK